MGQNLFVFHCESLGRGYQITNELLKDSEVQLVEAAPFASGGFLGLAIFDQQPKVELDQVEGQCIDTPHPDLLSGWSSLLSRPLTDGLLIIEGSHVPGLLKILNTLLHRPESSLLDLFSGRGQGGRAMALVNWKGPFPKELEEQAKPYNLQTTFVESPGEPFRQYLSN